MRMAKYEAKLHEVVRLHVLHAVEAHVLQNCGQPTPVERRELGSPPGRRSNSAHTDDRPLGGRDQKLVFYFCGFFCLQFVCGI